MKIYKEKRSGNSDAQSRQGGGIVPAPPRSGFGESGYGLPVVLPARTMGKWTIADDRKKRRRKMKQLKEEECNRRELLPLRLRGGGDSEEDDDDDDDDHDETAPFTGFGETSKWDRGYIAERVHEFDRPEAGSSLYN